MSYPDALDLASIRAPHGSRPQESTMPCVRIATGVWAAGSEMKLIEAVQSALVAAFRILERDRDVVLDLYEENRRIVSKGHSERYTRVEIGGIAARSIEAKRALFKAI